MTYRVINTLKYQPLFHSDFCEPFADFETREAAEKWMAWVLRQDSVKTARIVEMAD